MAKIPNVQRHKLTIKARGKFLEALAKTANVTRSAKAAGVTRQACYLAKRDDPEFSEAWDEAIEIAVDALEEEARRRAYKGCLEPVFYQGQKCGAVRKFSDTLLIFLLKAHRPEKFKERSEVNGNVKFDLGEAMEAVIARKAKREGE